MIERWCRGWHILNISNLIKVQCPKKVEWFYISIQLSKNRAQGMFTNSKQILPVFLLKDSYYLFSLVQIIQSFFWSSQSSYVYIWHELVRPRYAQEVPMEPVFSSYRTICYIPFCQVGPHIQHHWVMELLDFRLAQMEATLTLYQLIQNVNWKTKDLINTQEFIAVQKKSACNRATWH